MCGLWDSRSDKQDGSLATTGGGVAMLFATVALISFLQMT
jgi:hypothetical protein